MVLRRFDLDLSSASASCGRSDDDDELSEESRRQEGEGAKVTCGAKETVLRERLSGAMIM